MPLSVWSMNFAMMLGLAVGIDYSLFIVSRYREERAEGADPYDGVANTLATAGKAVFLSAFTVVFSLAAVFVVPGHGLPLHGARDDPLGRRRGHGVLTLLPAVMVALGDRVLRTRHNKDPHGTDNPDIAAEGRWARIVGVALRRPALTLVVGASLLLALAAPASGCASACRSPGRDEGRTSRDGYETWSRRSVRALRHPP